MEQGVLYDYSYTGITCRNNCSMTLTYNVGRGYRWRCHRYECCNKSSQSVLAGSFFSERKSHLNDQLLVLYMWLNRASRSTIQAFLGMDLKTIRGVIKDFHQVMQEDMVSGGQTPEDLKIGKHVPLTS